MGSIEEHKRLVDSILFTFGSLPDVRAFKRDVGLAYRDGHGIRYGVIGETDISGIVMGGRAWFCECKTGRSVLSTKQEKFREMVIKFGCIYVLARSQGIDDIPNATQLALTEFRRQM